MVQEFDVVVVGAGVIGAATSFELARTGRSVLCVDNSGAVGSGSTSASSAIIRFHYSTWDSVLTSWESAWLWWRFSEHLGTTASAALAKFVPTGALTFDFRGTNRDVTVALMRRCGIAVEDLSANQIRERFPALDVADFGVAKRVDDAAFFDDPVGEVGGYFTPDAGFIDDPMLAAQNFMDAAMRGGAKLRLHSKVVEIRRRGDAVVGVTLESGELIDAHVVVNVAGPASARINEMAGVSGEMKINQRPLRQEVHVATPPQNFGLDGTGPLVTDMGLGTYFRPHLGGTMIVGGTEPKCDDLEWVRDPDQFSDQPTTVGFERSMLRLGRRMPNLAIPSRPKGLAGLYDVTDDWVPIYDCSSLKGYFMACGTSGNQFKNAPMSGIFMTALVEASEQGIDHDTDPVQVVGAHTGMTINLGAFSRLREPETTTGTVMG